jgi:hypothetical protein
MARFFPCTSKYSFTCSTYTLYYHFRITDSMDKFQFARQGDTSDGAVTRFGSLRHLFYEHMEGWYKKKQFITQSPIYNKIQQVESMIK